MSLGGKRRRSGASHAVWAWAGAFSLAGALAAAEPAYETPSNLRAERFLPAGEMAGADWRVEPTAANDGFGNTYTITSRFGTWEASGTVQALIRIREIQALAELEEVSKTEVFTDAVKKSVTAPIDLVASAATQPVATVKAIPSSVGRWFKTTTFRVQETYRDAQEARAEREAARAAAGESGSDGSAATEGDRDDLIDKSREAAQSHALRYLKITAAERHWYAKLGIDPSTDNELLREAITSVARVEGLTGFGMRFVGIPSLPGASEMRKTMDLVWKTDPWELRRSNRERLLAAGLSEATARELEDNPALTLTHQTALLDALERLEGVGGRAHVIARAIDVEDRDEAERLVSSMALLVRFHRTQEPLREILAGTRLPVARAVGGDLVAVTRTDALFWTEAVAAAARRFAETYAAETAPARLFWIAGEASPGFRAGAESLGWSVRDRWQLAAPEDAAEGRAGR